MKGYMIVFIIMLILSDHISKFWAEKKLKGKKVITILPNALELRYAKNYGAAYNLFEKHRIFLLLVNIGLLFFVSYLYIMAQGISEITAYAFILGGGYGNFISRIHKKYVTDFIYFKIKKAPIFNLADFFIIIGVVFYYLFT